MNGISLEKIYSADEVYERIGSKTMIWRLERRGMFPRRHYFDADMPRPRRPFWLKSEVDAWLAARVERSEEARAKAGHLGARLIRAKHLKAAA